MVETKDTFQYIPLLDVLQAMLKNDLIFKEVHILSTYVYEKQFSYYFIIHFKVMHGHQRKDQIVEDFCDSVQAKTHPLFSNDKTALQLLLFYDELEVCNPIGSSRKKHKIGNYVYIYYI